MFLSPVLLGISNIITGILQVFHRFLVTALAPLMYNIGIISGILFFVPNFGIQGLAWGVVLGGLLHLLIQIPAFLNSGFKIYDLRFTIKNFRHPGVLKTLKLMAPRSMGLGAMQFNTIIITA
ncbi:MAG: lipid II flippase MurJ, partial [Patescibacteria group bacterium]